MRKKLKIKRINSKRGQTFIEYALVITITVGVLLVMHNYWNRSLQGRLKSSIDAANPTGDYTTSAGRGTMSKTASSFIWENNRGHQITWRSTWRNESFSIDSAAELPFIPRTPCEGAECILRNVEDELAASSIGEAAMAGAQGQEGPLGQEGVGVDISDEDAQYYQELVSRRIDDGGDDGDEDTEVQQFSYQSVIDSSPGVVNPDEFDQSPDPDCIEGEGPGCRQEFNPGATDVLVDELTGSVISSGAAPEWAVPLLLGEDE